MKKIHELKEAQNLNFLLNQDQMSQTS